MSRRRSASNAQGLERTLKALTAEGRLDEDDEALVALARCLAAALDAEPENAAALAREYRQALVALSAAGADTVDDDTRDFILSIRTPNSRAPVRDAPQS